MNKPKLDDLANWPLDKVQEQYDAEQSALIEFLDSPTRQQSAYVGGPKYHDLTSMHYRLGYMRWLLAGSPQPMPRFA